MTEETLPVAEAPEANAQPAEQAPATETAAPAEGATDKPAEAKPDDKPAKTPEQKEIERLQRRIDARTKRAYEAEARMRELEEQLSRFTKQIGSGDNQAATDSDTLTLSRAQLQQLVDSEARKIAPALREQQTAIERRQGVIDSLATSWGQELFDERAADLDAAFGGLKAPTGQVRPATDALFEADDPAALIEYLADPDNAAEARNLARLGPVQAGVAIARLEQRLKAEKERTKPQPSKLPPPVEAPKAQGSAVEKDPSQMSDAEFAAWRRKQIKSRGF